MYMHLRSANDTHHHTSFGDYADPPKTKGEEGQIRHRTSPPYSLATSASGTQHWIHNFDSSYRQTLSKPKATMWGNTHDEQSKPRVQALNFDCCMINLSACAEEVHSSATPPSLTKKHAERVHQLSLARQRSKTSCSLWLLKQAGHFA